MNRLPGVAALAASLALTLPAWAGQTVTPSKPMSASARSLVRGAAGRSLSMIQGQAVYTDRSPIAFANLRLRNTETGRIEQMTTANYTGDFSFLADPGAPYIIELVDEAGRVLATGSIIVANAGQTAGALVMLPTRIPTLAGLFGNTAGAIISSAASTGITAVTATSPNQSPEE